MADSHRRDFDDALNRLPLPYSVALRLREAGIEDAVIAECVGVEPEGLHALMLIAQAKLDAVGQAVVDRRGRSDASMPFGSSPSVPPPREFPSE